MDKACTEGGALAESVVFLKNFSDLPDPRQRGKVMYRLDEILLLCLLCLLAVLAGAETIVDIARFGEKKRELLRRFRPFGDGTPPQASHPCFAGAGPKLASPSHDHLGDILASLDAEAFQRCFVAWVGSLTGVATDVIAIDGKTVRSYQKKGGTAPIHMVSAFAARQRLVLGQVKVANKATRSRIIIDSQREIDGKIETETRLYITSLVLLANALGPIVRSHWAVENSLHWVMDMIFRDDECRVRTDHAPANFTTLKHMAINLTGRAPGKDSLRLKRKVAAWDDDFLASLIAA